MRVLITGAAGLVGSALAAAYREHDVIALRHRQLDITDARAVDDTIKRSNPSIVFNCAVIGVDDCERDPDLARAVNVDGPAALARASESVGAAIVHFSSNYVFDGERTNGIPYSADDEALPANVYGVTKLEGERAVAAACSRAYVVRTSWVFGKGKASFLSTVAQKLARGERVEAISDTFASSTYVDDLVRRVGEVLATGHRGTYQTVNDGVCSYADFAMEAARLVGASPSLIDVVTESSLGRLAPRPRWTPMRCLISERLGLKPMRDWRAALAAYVQGG